jgi:hypothetical protein
MDANAAAVARAQQAAAQGRVSLGNKVGTLDGSVPVSDTLRMDQAAQIARDAGLISAPAAGDAEDPFFAEQRRQNRISAVAYLRGLLDQYGLGELAGSVESLVDQYQSNVNAIAEGLRQTQQYKDRFKGLIALRNKGVTDIANEGQYLDLETNYRRAFQDAGIGGYIGTPGSVAERDAIADLVGKYSVSVDEVKTRIADAARVVNSTAREVKDAFRDFYGATDNDIIAMSLLPERATAEINRRANAATLAGIARQSGLNLGSGAAERVADLSGDSDMSMDFALRAAADTRQVADATQRLANIEQSLLSDDETLLSTTGIDEGARRKVRGLQSRERGRFSGATAFGTGSLSTATGV